MEIPLIRHPESVTVVPVDGDEIVLVNQTRRGASKRILELPAGAMEPGENPAETARRELAEECGLAAATWRELGSFWAVPAYSTEFVHVFEATELSAVTSPHLDEDEDIQVERAAAGEAEGLVSDAVSLAALALWRLRAG